jgi:hypothetical protein
VEQAIIKMQTKMKTAVRLTIAAFGLAIFTVSTGTLEAQDYIYIITNGTITITEYTGPGGDATIPAEINGLPVTTIGSRAFQYCTSLTTVTIPNNVTELNMHVFAFCSSLTNVTIPNSVTSIGSGAFVGCTNLTSVAIPNSVTDIGGDGWGVFSGGAFEECTSLACVTIPTSVTNIGDLAFCGCASLTDITIPQNVTIIGQAAFARCASLMAITVDPLNPAHCSVDGVLFDKSRTCLMQFPSGKPGRSYTIPNGVIHLQRQAFDSCNTLTNVNILGSVTTIGENAFWLCGGLTTITIGTSVTTIGDFAFDGCTNLSAAYFRGNAPSAGSGVFEVTPASIYYLSGTIGWGTTFADRPTAPWVLPYPVILTTPPNFGIQTNAFGFRISWATNASVVVEASATLANPVWSQVSTNTLTGGWSYFSDAEWTNHPARFYRVRQW